MTTVQKINNYDMATSTDTSNPSILNLFACKCPRCRRGDMFQDKNPWNLKNTMKMKKECSVCKQPFVIEVGFYFGSSYISYALTVALSVATFIAWWVLLGISINDNSLFYWLAVNAVILVMMQPYLMRVARTGWLAFFVKYNKNWKTIPPQMDNKDQETSW